MRHIIGFNINAPDFEEIETQADNRCKLYFGKTPFEILEIRARPAAQAIGGEILLWEADIEASAVYA